MTQLLGTFSGWPTPITNSWHLGKKITSTVVEKSRNFFSRVYAAMPCTKKKQPFYEAEFQRIEIVIDRTPLKATPSMGLHQEIRTAVSANILEIEHIKKKCISACHGFDKMDHARMCIAELERCRAFIFKTPSTPQETASEVQAIRDRLHVLLHSTLNSGVLNAADLQHLKEGLQHLNKLMLQADLF